MIQQNISWQSNDGLTFFAHIWEPDQKPKAVITLVHGFGEHCMRYTPYLQYFINDGFAMLGFDHRGHGQTEGKRGTIKSYNALMDDIEMALNKTSELFPAIPHFIYGHSMGGNLVMNYLLRRTPNLKGAIVTSPWLALFNDPNPVVKGLVSLLKNIIPNTTIESGLNTNYISTDKTEVEKYNTDPLNHGRISFLLFDTITKTGKWAIANSSKLNIPVLLMHGADDKITSPKASKQAYEGNKNWIEFKIWEGRYHELHNETNRVEVAETVLAWLKKNL